MFTGPIYVLDSFVLTHFRVGRAPILLASPILVLLGEVLVLHMCDLRHDPF